MSSVYPCCISVRDIAPDCIFSTVDACTETIDIRSRGRGGGLVIRARPSLGAQPIS